MYFHLNNGSCEGCKTLFDRYPGFHIGLRKWFLNIQNQYPEAHISCAGRGKLAQEECYKNKVSKSIWGQSPHNYNLAIDVFRQESKKSLFDRSWFEAVMLPFVVQQNMMDDFQIDWFGMAGSPFYELPHFQVRHWRTLNFPLVKDVEDDLTSPPGV